VFKKCNREITVPNKPDESVKKLVRDTLLRGYDIYPKQSKKPAQVRRREVTSSVQSLKLADLKLAADEPPRKSRKQKLDKWQ